MNVGLLGVQLKSKQEGLSEWWTEAKLTLTAESEEHGEEEGRV